MVVFHRGVSRAVLAFALLAIFAYPSIALADDASDGADSTCVDTHTLQTPAGLRTNCAPYICTSSSCLRACETAEDCVTGRVCYQSKCEIEEAIAPPESSCDVRHAPSSGADGIAFLVGAAALFVRSRWRTRPVV